jgi:hypothetical protein
VVTIVPLSRKRVPAARTVPKSATAPEAKPLPWIVTRSPPKAVPEEAITRWTHRVFSSFTSRRPAPPVPESPREAGFATTRSQAPVVAVPVTERVAVISVEERTTSLEETTDTPEPDVFETERVAPLMKFVPVRVIGTSRVAPPLPVRPIFEGFIAVRVGVAPITAKAGERVPESPPLAAERVTVRLRSPVEAPPVTVADAVIFPSSTIVTDEKETPLPLAATASPERNPEPRRVTAIDEAPWARVGALKEPTAGGAMATVAAPVKVFGDPPPAPGVTVTSRAPRAAVEDTEISRVSFVEESTIAEWTVTPAPDTVTAVPVLKFEPVATQRKRDVPGSHAAGAREVRSTPTGITSTAEVFVAEAPPPPEWA